MEKAVLLQELAGSNAAPATSRAFVICTAPRTGSSLLSEALESTGIAGRPNEYFDIYDHNRRYWMQRLGAESDAEYLSNAIAAGTTPNGVFGLKLHWHQIPALFAVCPELPADAAPDELAGVMQRRFGAVNYLWLRRRNKVAQAISYFRASYTDHWRSRHGAQRGKPDPDFDFDVIDQFVRRCEQFDECWDGYFRRQRARVLMLVYEDLVGAFDQSIQRVCDHLGVGVGVAAPPALSRQADDLSLAWEEDYRRRKNDPGARPALFHTAAAEGSGTPAAQIPVAGRPADTVPDQPAPVPPKRRAASRKKTGGGQALRDDLPILTAYDLETKLGVQLAPASPRRAWMDNTPAKAPYRCLPMLIANQNGWMLHSPCRIEATWGGAPTLDSLVVKASDPVTGRLAHSHFGSGILTFSVGMLFRTPPGVNLYVRGPANMPKDGICALEGIVETDWIEATFTVNWMLTRPHHTVVFEEGEPFAMISPVKRGEVEQVQPVIKSISSDPALLLAFNAWSKSRLEFNKDLKVTGSEARKQGWQRHYTRGETALLEKAPEHQTALNVRDFVDLRSGGPPTS